MAAVDSRARRRLNRWDMPDPVYWVWKKLTSVKVAIALIAVTALMSFISVIIPQVPAQFTNSAERIAEHVELQRGTWGPVTDVLAEFPWFYDARGGIFNLFNQPYWFALVVILALSITTCTVSRFAPIWRTVRRPQRRVNDAYFERARHRLDFAVADAGAVEQGLRRRRYRVQREERDGAVYFFADRFGWAQLGTFLSHAGLVALVLGTVITKVGAEEIQFWIGEGESRPLFATAGDRQQIQVIVDDASANFAADGQALDFRSAVRVTSQGAELAAGDVTVNGPITFDGWRLHQAAYYENGAALQVRDVRDGQLVYSETLMLDEQLFGPRVRITNGRTGALISEEVVPPAFAIDGLEDSGYQLIPLDSGVSLALILVSSPQDEVEFHYAVVPFAADDVAAHALQPAQLRLNADPPVSPRVRLSDSGSDEPFADVVVPLAARDDLPDARVGAIPVSDELTLTVGFAEQEGARQFFYFVGGEDAASGSADTQPLSGFLQPGERVVVQGLELEYVGQAFDRSQWGRLEPGETQAIGAVDLTYAGSESVFFRSEPDVPGATGDALILVERFGQGQTAGTFEARGGENVQLTREAGEVGDADDSRPPRLGLGLGGDRARVDLNPGEAVVIGNYEYLFLGPREFTGLTVRHDPGAWIVWGAIIGGILGLIIVLLVPRRRVWARVTQERTYLAGLAGHGVNLQREMGAFARDLGASDAPPEEVDE